MFGLNLEALQSADEIVAWLGDQASKAMRTTKDEFMRKPNGYMDQWYKED